MSILLGPFDNSDQPTEDSSDSKEFLIFGYQCRLYRDDDRATMENEGTLLIPWMGDKSLMVDRYDVRNRFDDKAQFGLKSNLPQKFTEEEEEFERLLDEERYMALGTDITEEELRREEEEKRMYEQVAPSGTYHAVEFSYGSSASSMDGAESPVQLVNQPQQQEHLSTTYVDDPEEGGEYERPFRLFLPPNIQVPFSQKLHAVIERTALFISTQGQQMEIIIKTKQRFNPNFSFLHHEDRLFPYYKHILNCIKNGTYEPTAHQTTNESTDGVSNDMESNEQAPPMTKQQEQVGNNTDNSARNNAVVQYDESEDSEEEEEFELHPILRANLPLKSSATAKSKPSQNLEPTENSDSTSMDNSFTSKFKSRTFKSIAYTINSAPSVTEDCQTNGTSGSYSTTSGNSVSAPSTSGTTVSGDQVMSGVLAPGYTICNGYDPMLAYYQASQVYQKGAVPPPPDLQPVVDKTAEYVAKNGDNFEKTVILKHLSDAKFGFLHPWNQYNHYYKTKVSEFKDLVKAAQENAPTNMQKLDNFGAISFKMMARKSVTPVLSKGADMGVDEEEEGNPPEDENQPLNKKIKLSEEEIVMDHTVKQFLLTVKNTF